MSSSPPFPRRRDWLLLAAFLLLLLTFRLGGRGLNEPDEGRYANIALAMVQHGDWWEPRMSGYGHYDKPPLIYWTTALSLRLFGANEWAARAPSLLGALLALVGLGWAGARLRGPRVAWWAVLICGSSVQFWTLGRILSPDMLLTGWCTLAIGAWAECRHRGGAIAFWWVSLAAWSLAWWTKATPALIPLAGLAIGIGVTRDQAGWNALQLWRLFPAIIVLGSPWYLSMLHEYPELRGFFFGRELAGRMAGHVDGRHGSLFYYVPISLVAWLPWWPIAAWIAWKQRAALGAVRDWSRRAGVEGWILIVGFLIFSLAGSKLPTYTLTLAPWAALLMARALTRVEDRRLLLPAAGFAALALAATFILPARESNLGVNSSLREVCAFLKTHHIHHADSDHYWPGMEFYLGEDVVRYVNKHNRLQERASDPGLAPVRFIEPDEWLDLTIGNVRAPDEPAGERWLIHFRRQQDSVFNAFFADPQASGRQIVRIGGFDLLRWDSADAIGKGRTMGEAGAPSP